MATAALPLVVAKPRQVRVSARAIGHLAKTDRLDAVLLARFGQQVRPTPRPLPDAAQALDSTSGSERPASQLWSPLMACMRTLLTILNAIVRHDTPWRAVERPELDTVAC